MSGSMILNPALSSTGQPVAKNSELMQKAGLFREQKEYKIPRLALLDEMVAAVKHQGSLPDLSNTIFIGAQHMLETTVTLFDALIELGAKPTNMFFSGKCYSSAPEIEAQVRKRGIHLMPSNKPRRAGEYEEYCQDGIAKMWELCLKKILNRPIDRIIILDDGGRCLENMPRFVGARYKVAAVEQTRAGLYSESMELLLFPLIKVATSAAKKLIEPHMIATAILRRVKALLSSLNPNSDTAFGIIGNGAIGNGICNYLLSLGYTVFVYDPNDSAFQEIVNEKFFRMGSIKEVINNADILFGCTGRDITEGIDALGIIKQDTVLVSCTSEDKEFRSLLRTISSQRMVAIDTLADITCLSRNERRIVILQGGFPINFDRKPWNVPADEIEMTQGLLLGGCLQGITSATKPIQDGRTINQGSHQCLDPWVQQYVTLHWLSRHPSYPQRDKYIKTFSDIGWIKKSSDGRYYENPFIKECFSNINPITVKTSSMPSSPPSLKSKL